jgi:hypothetical protein
MVRPRRHDGLTPNDQLTKDPGSVDDQTFAVHVRRAQAGSDDE